MPLCLAYQSNSRSVWLIAGDDVVEVRRAFSTPSYIDLRVFRDGKEVTRAKLSIGGASLDFLVGSNMVRAVLTQLKRDSSHVQFIAPKTVLIYRDPVYQAMLKKGEL